jgi:hypothetical protein
MAGATAGLSDRKAPWVMEGEQGLVSRNFRLVAGYGLARDVDALAPFCDLVQRQRARPVQLDACARRHIASAKHRQKISKSGRHGGLPSSTYYDLAEARDASAEVNRRPCIPRLRESLHPLPRNGVSLSAFINCHV